MDAEKLLSTVTETLEDIKGYNIDVINVTDITSLFEYVVIASADSTRQVKSLARNIEERIKAIGGTVYSVEGELAGEWLLVDLGDIIVHVMLPAVREYYNLRALWSR